MKSLPIGGLFICSGLFTYLCYSSFTSREPPVRTRKRECAMLGKITQCTPVLNHVTDSHGISTCEVLYRCDTKLRFVSKTQNTPDDIDISFETVMEHYEANGGQLGLVRMPHNEARNFVELMHHGCTFEVYYRVTPTHELLAVGLHFGDRNYDI